MLMYSPPLMVNAFYNVLSSQMSWLSRVSLNESLLECGGLVKYIRTKTRTPSHSNVCSSSDNVSPG